MQQIPVLGNSWHATGLVPLDWRTRIIVIRETTSWASQSTKNSLEDSYRELSEAGRQRLYFVRYQVLTP